MEDSVQSILSFSRTWNERERKQSIYRDGPSSDSRRYFAISSTVRENFSNPIRPTRWPFSTPANFQRPNHPPGHVIDSRKGIFFFARAALNFVFTTDDHLLRELWTAGDLKIIFSLVIVESCFMLRGSQNSISCWDYIQKYEKCNCVYFLY